MPPERPPSFQWYPRDFAAAMHQLGVSDEVELAYRRALDASWDEGCYGVGTLEQWAAWGRVAPGIRPEFERLLGLATQAQADGVLVQIRMARCRMEQALRYKSSAKRGSDGGRKSKGGKRRKPTQATVKQTQPSASASASAEKLESKTASSLRSEAPTAPNSRSGKESIHGPREIVRGLAARMDLAPRAPTFPNSAAWAWITTELRPRDPKAAMEFMGWAWKHLGPDLPTIQGMVLEWRDKRIENPRAYFSANGAGGCRIDTTAADLAERENNARKAEEQAWLNGAK